MHSSIATVTPSAALEGYWDLIPWSEGFATGDAGLDDDHQKLLSLFNEFSMAVNAGRSDSVVRSILDDLLDYTHYHFAREEMLMLESGYPDILQHKRMHDKFACQVNDACTQLSIGGDMSAFLLSFLGKWLSNHILGADRLLGRHLSQCRVA